MIFSAARRRFARALGASVATLWLGALPAAQVVAQDVPPTHAFSTDQEAIRTGMGVFRLRCADCHGTDARGVRGPDLTQLWAAGRTDEGIFRTITEGVPGTNMRPIDRVRTRDSEVWQIIAYLRSIASPAVTQTTGDAMRGEQIFAASCAVCHQIDAAGGRLGPDLSRIGLARSVDALKRRIRGDYGKMVDPTYAPTTLTTAAGERWQGVKKNEDLASIQVIDTTGRIQGFEKETLRSLDVSTTSIMPAFAPEMLGETALEDLVSYLVTLRGYDAAVE
ncbi:MAG TPA: c-type cytochrome [Gammaproteobacteria bacterium]|nr:c-type cytochrome [Gammaproteobacteria bacterium]